MNGVDVACVIPRGKRANMVRLYGGPERRAAFGRGVRFINFLLDRHMAAKNSGNVAYANGSVAGQKYIGKAVLHDPGVYTDAATHSKLYTIPARGPRAQRLITRLWVKVKTGE